MQNHDEKITDVIRSVLPSTARRDARRTRQLIHRAAPRKVNVAMQSGHLDAVVDIRGPIEDMVWDRRAADKVGPLVRWALHQVRHDPRLREAGFAERIDHFRQLLPNNTIGRHALSHIAAARAPRLSAARVRGRAELRRRGPCSLRGWVPRRAERAAQDPAAPPPRRRPRH